MIEALIFYIVAFWVVGPRVINAPYPDVVLGLHALAVVSAGGVAIVLAIDKAVRVLFNV